MYLFTFHKYNSPEIHTSCQVVSNFIIYNYLENLCIIWRTAFTVNSFFWKSCFPLVSRLAHNSTRRHRETHSTWTPSMYAVNTSAMTNNKCKKKSNKLIHMYCKSTPFDSLFFSLLSFHFAMLIYITILRILWISRHESLTYFWTHECFNWIISSSANCINFARWKPYMDLHDYTFFIKCQLKIVNSGK